MFTLNHRWPRAYLLPVAVGLRVALRKRRARARAPNVELSAISLPLLLSPLLLSSTQLSSIACAFAFSTAAAAGRSFATRVCANVDGGERAAHEKQRASQQWLGGERSVVARTRTLNATALQPSEGRQRGQHYAALNASSASSSATQSATAARLDKLRSERHRQLSQNAHAAAPLARRFCVNTESGCVASFDNNLLMHFIVVKYRPQRSLEYAVKFGSASAGKRLYTASAMRRRRRLLSAAILWFLAFVVCMTALCIQISYLISKYLLYTKTVDLDLKVCAQTRHQ